MTDFLSRTAVREKNIIVDIATTLRPDGSKNFFTNEHMLVLRCATVTKITLKQGEETRVRYEEFYNIHNDPFPVGMRFRYQALKDHRDHWTVVPWTQETETALVNACNGIKRIIDMLHGALSTPDQLILAVASLAAGNLLTATADKNV